MWPSLFIVIQKAVQCVSEKEAREESGVKKIKKKKKKIHRGFLENIEILSPSWSFPTIKTCSEKYGKNLTKKKTEKNETSKKKI